MDILAQMRTMMVYLASTLGDFVRANVGKYSITMEHMGWKRKVVKVGWYTSLKLTNC